MPCVHFSYSIFTFLLFISNTLTRHVQVERSHVTVQRSHVILLLGYMTCPDVAVIPITRHVQTDPDTLLITFDDDMLLPPTAAASLLAGYASAAGARRNGTAPAAVGLSGWVAGGLLDRGAAGGLQPGDYVGQHCPRRRLAGGAHVDVLEGYLERGLYCRP